MFIRVERASSTPISRQIAQQIEAHCLSGGLKPGDRLPSVRELARELAVNQNTVLRVYERLAGQGLLDRRHGDGTFVSANPPLRRLPEQVRAYRTQLEQTARHGLMLGLDGSELERLFADAVRSAAAGIETAAGEPSTTSTRSNRTEGKP